MIIQWGYIKHNSNQNQKVVLPIAFSGDNFVVNWNFVGGNASGDGYYCRYMGNRTSSGFTINDFLLNRYDRQWTAIGY